MKLLVGKQDVVDVTVYCYEVDGQVEATHVKTETPQDVEVVEKVNFQFRKPGYADSNVIIRNAGVKIEGEETSLNAQAFQDQILRSLLTDWDLKDEDGKKIPMNNLSINNLVPSVARAAVGGVLEVIRI